MNKFVILLKKEVLELLTPQMLIPFIATMAIFYGVGQLANKQAQSNKQPQEIAVLDKDNSDFSQGLIKVLETSAFKVSFSDRLSEADFLAKSKEKGIILSLIIPADFKKDTLQLKAPLIKTYYQISDFTLPKIQKYASLGSSVAFLNNATSDYLISSQIKNVSPAILKNPLKTQEFVTINNHSASVSVNALMAYLSSQTAFVPAILFLVIVLASQMIAMAMASEKENKTLETLLSAPIARSSIILSKMLSAGLVGLLLVGFYMAGFSSFMGASGNALGQGISKDIIAQLGLSMTPAGYFLFGLTLLMGILTALAIAIILGSFAEDIKSVQGLTMPLMVLLLIPYFVTLILDIQSLPMVIKIVFYAIPFSHIFLALPNLMLGNFSLVILGILYQSLVFVVFVSLATWIFSTDKIMTMKLSFRKKQI